MEKIIKNTAILLFFFISITVNAQQPTNNSTTSKASFAFDSYVHDYGNIPEKGGLASHTFTVTNTGTEPIVINQAAASCGCTTPTHTTTPIPPGQSGQVNVA